MKTTTFLAWSGYFAIAAVTAIPVIAAENVAIRAPQPGVAPATEAMFVEVAATAGTLRQLRAVGYALYLRHGLTNNAIPDRMPAVDLNDCSTQSSVTDRSRQIMAQVGESMRAASIPIGEFKVSPMCRARQSAAAAFPASTPAPKGKNRLILAHAPNLMNLIGYFPTEGTLVIFRPKGDGGFDYMACAVPARWSEILK